MKKYDVVYTDDAIKSIKNIDRIHQIRIKKWIQTNIDGCSNPYFGVKPLKGDLKDYLRYRAGKYRIFAKTDNGRIVITTVKVGCCQGVYDS